MNCFMNCDKKLTSHQSIPGIVFIIRKVCIEKERPLFTDTHISPLQSLSLTLLCSLSNHYNSIKVDAY